MKHRRILGAVIIIIIVGLIIMLDHSYFFWSKPGNKKGQTGQKFSDSGPDKTAPVSPFPSVSPSKDKAVTDMTDKAANSQGTVAQPNINSQANDRAPSAPAAASQPSAQPTAQPAPQPTVQPSVPPSETPNTATRIPDAIPKAVEDKAGTIAKGEVQTDDFLKVASLLIGKLSLTEIKYLFDSASDDYWVVTPVEEIEKARSILFSKLSADDLNQLYTLGKKYGRSMSIIDPNLDVADAKARQVKAWEEKNKQTQQQ